MSIFLRLFLCLALFNSSVLALTLNESLEQAYVNYEQFQIQRIEYLKSLESFPQAISGFLPDINLGIGLQDQKSNIRSKDFPARNSTSPLQSRNSQTTLSINQNLFNGGKTMANLKIAQLSAKVARCQFYDTEQKNLIEATTALVNYVAAKEKFDVSNISVANNQQQFEAATEKEHLGEGTITEVATAKSALATATSNQLQAHGNFLGAGAEFVRIFGVKPESITMPELLKNLPLTKTEFLQLINDHNLNIEASKYNISISKADTLAAIADLSPTVNASITRGNIRYLPESTNLQNGLDSNSVTTSLNVNIPILSRGGVVYSNIRTKKNASRGAAYTLDATRKATESKGIAAWETFQAYNHALGSATEAIIAAELSYEGITQEQLLGSKTMLDVLAAEEKLTQARIQKIDIEKAVVLNSCQMKALIGQFTAKALKLNVKYFNPEVEFKKAKFKIVGF